MSFPLNWAYYRKTKGDVKLHTELDLSGNLPCFLLMSNGKMSDIRAAKENIPILPDSSDEALELIKSSAASSDEILAQVKAILEK